MKKRFKKARLMLIGGVLGGLVLLSTVTGEAVEASVDIRGKCTLTIDANKNTTLETLARGTGACSRSVVGRYYTEAKSFELAGATTKFHVVSGQKEIVSIPPKGSYELTIYIIPLGETEVPNLPVKPELKQVFKDVPNSFWAAEEINDMHARGIINGYPDKTFNPHKSISRAHVASLLARTLDLAPVREAQDFKDLPRTHSLYEDIQTVYRAGIFDGKGDGTFGVNDNLTRAQMAKVLMVAFDLEPYRYEGTVFFGDVGTNHWANNYVASLYMNDIAFGSIHNGNHKYLPNSNVTRAHYAVFLHRALNVAESNTPNTPIEPTPPTKPEQTGLITDDYEKPEDVPTPQGYVSGKYEEELEKELLELRNENQHDSLISIGIYGLEGEVNQLIRDCSRAYGVTESQLRDIINETIETGKVYDGGHFSIYYGYDRGTLVISGGIVEEGQ